MPNIYDEAMQKYYTRNPDSNMTPEEFFAREAAKHYCPGNGIIYGREGTYKTALSTVTSYDASLTPDERRSTLTVIKGGKWDSSTLKKS